MTRVIELPDLADALQRYRAGEPEQKLALELGVSRPAFRRRLLWAGIEPRGISEANSLRMRRLSAEERQALSAAANDATRGRKQPFERRLRQALGREAMQRITEGEALLARLLAERHIVVAHQKAIGPYNIDLAIEEVFVAVEIFGGGWHATGRHRARFDKRTEYLRDAGWAQLNIWVDGRRYLLSERTADYIIAFLKELRRVPAVRRQYRMVLANGEPPASYMQF